MHKPENLVVPEQVNAQLRQANTETFNHLITPFTKTLLRKSVLILYSCREEAAKNSKTQGPFFI